MARGLVAQIDDRPNGFSWPTGPGSDDFPKLRRH